MFDKKSAVLFAVVVSIGLGASAAVAQLVTSGSDQAVPPVSADKAVSELAGTVATVGRAQTADERADGIADAAQASEIGDADETGENLALLREANDPSWAGKAVLWPAEGAVCMATEGVSSCVGVSQLDAEAVSVMGYAGPAVGEGVTRVAGIARNGVTQVTLVTADGAKSSADVVDNMFVLDTKAAPTSLEWTASDGTSGTKDLGRSFSPDASEPLDNGKIQVETAP